MSMRIALGHVDVYDDEVATYALQLGLGSVQLHNPANLTLVDGSWPVEQLVALRERIEARGLVLEGIENVPAEAFDDIQRGGPRREQQLEAYRQTIRNLGAAGITTLGYHFIVTYVWRTDMHTRGRGDARVTAFDLDRIGDGNALATHTLTPHTPPPEGLDAAALWEHHRVFLEEVLPTAEQAGVRLALHPDDPPVDVDLGGAARIFISPAALARADEQSGGSPAWGVNLCLGTISELGGADSVREAIELLGPGKRIVYVHFRDVRGTVPRFEECFLGEGNLDPAEVLRQLDEVGFDGFVIDDHVPAMLGDPDTWGDTSVAAYCSRGRAHAIGYLQGALQALRSIGAVRG